jgi:transcriptional regulator with XRE-family HTH domain
MHERIRFLRKKLGLTQEGFGKKLGVSCSVIANIELNRVIPNDYFIVHLIDIFGVNQFWLSSGEGEIFNSAERYDPEFEKFWKLYIELKPNLRQYLLDQLIALKKLQENEYHEKTPA